MPAVGHSEGRDDTVDLDSIQVTHTTVQNALSERCFHDKQYEKLKITK